MFRFQLFGIWFHLCVFVPWLFNLKAAVETAKYTKYAKGLRLCESGSFTRWVKGFFGRRTPWSAFFSRGSRGSRFIPIAVSRFNQFPFSHLCLLRFFAAKFPLRLYSFVVQPVPGSKVRTCPRFPNQDRTWPIYIDVGSKMLFAILRLLALGAVSEFYR